MLPVATDVVAPTVAIFNNLLNWYLFLGFAAGTVVTVYMVYNLIINRAKNVKGRPEFHHEEESGWGNWKTVVLTLMVTGSVLAFVEYETFASVGLITPPNTTGDPITINVTGQQFVWSFTYSNGYTAFKNLVLPQNEIVYLNITSVDVDHSFSIQSLDVAKDALPGEHSVIWVNATNLGTFVNDIRCKELCGTGHATMIGNLTVMTQSGFASWLASKAPASSVSPGGSPPATGPTYTIILPSGVGSNQQLNFQPSTVSVAPGTTIVFVNKDTSTHDIDFTSIPSGAASIASSPNTPQWTNGQWSVTLTTPGTYTYICDYHSWMKGTITVT